MTLQTIDPATGEPLDTHPELDAAGIERALARADAAFASWRTTGFDARAVVLRRVAARLREDTETHARRMAREMGKPVREGRAEAEKCAWVCEYYAEHAAGFLASEPIPTDAARSYVRFDPLGALLAVMPWNFPYWQVFRAAAPALMAGNVVLLKHASNVPGCARAIDDLFRDAGLPTGVFQSLPIRADAVGGVVAHPVVRAVTLTGSEATGRAVAAQAGRSLKKIVLELGGSDPFVVLDDVDVARVAREAARARTINAGQSCIAAKRFIVLDAVADRFIDGMAAELEALRVGDPLDPETEVGPLARADLVQELDAQVRQSVAAGARLRTGGAPLPRAGFFYAPTLLADARPGMRVVDEETFGPVAAVVRVGSEDEAVRVANAHRYGLGASLWSGDPARAERLVERIEAGAVFVNGIVKSDPRLPFGGVKDSGHGRELSAYGIREFVNVKAIWVGGGARS
jgi:succinate-semialdehyde dehydrogenase / glutarate-semialdehyde dehydrogenase